MLIVDQHDYRLEFASQFARCETVNFRELSDPVWHLKKEAGWLGWDAAIDAVGCEAHGSWAQRAVGIRPFKLLAGAATAMQWAIDSVRKGGIVSIVGVYGPPLNAVPIGDALNKGLTFRMGQANVKRNLPRCFEHIRAGHITPSDVITHRLPLTEISEGYRIFSSRLDKCIKPIIIPPGAG